MRKEKNAANKVKKQAVPVAMRIVTFSNDTYHKLC